MKHYRVEAEVHCKRLFFVEADNEEDAIEEAREQAYSDAYGDADVYINYAKEEV